jgi:hypothetical protein
VNENAFFGIFPFAFIGMWLLITTILGIVSGWRALVERFPDSQDPALERLHFQSAAIGTGSFFNPWGNVSYSSCLRFDVCHTGLRVKIWRIFSPFEKPFLVPWAQIAVEEKKFLFLNRYRLTFGDPSLSALTINPQAYRRIAANSPLRNR